MIIYGLKFQKTSTGKQIYKIHIYSWFAATIQSKIDEHTFASQKSISANDKVQIYEKERQPGGRSFE